MANDLNSLQFIGRLGGEPESRYTPSGTQVCNFNVAVGNEWNDKDGNKQKVTTWYRATAWAKLAEICAKYLHKGTQVYIEGRLEPTIDIYTANDGTQKASYKVRVNTLEMLGGPKGTTGEDKGFDTPPTMPESNPEDEIPF